MDGRWKGELWGRREETRRDAVSNHGERGWWTWGSKRRVKMWRMGAEGLLASDVAGMDGRGMWNVDDDEWYELEGWKEERVRARERGGVDPALTLTLHQGGLCSDAAERPASLRSGDAMFIMLMFEAGWGREGRLSEAEHDVGLEMTRTMGEFWEGTGVWCMREAMWRGSAEGVRWDMYCMNMLYGKGPKEGDWEEGEGEVDRGTEAFEERKEREERERPQVKARVAKVQARLSQAQVEELEVAMWQSALFVHCQDEVDFKWAEGLVEYASEYEEKADQMFGRHSGEGRRKEGAAACGSRRHFP
jgi:hypothetical protein